MIRRLFQPPWRTVFAGLVVLAAVGLGYFGWRPGLDLRDGRFDRKANGIWLSHVWLGDDAWFLRNGKSNQLAEIRRPETAANLVRRLKAHHITDLFPHLCPINPDGSLPPHDRERTEAFLDATTGLRVLPWVGGPYGSAARLHKAEWRSQFARSLRLLLEQHPRFAGIQVNVEPLTSGDRDFLALLDSLRTNLPPGKLLSVAAYPPPTRWQPSLEVHWEESFFREVARRCDQLAVMMYDVGQRWPKAYQQLMGDWTQEVLSWSEGKPVLIGVPTYDDAGSGYHDPAVENPFRAIPGIRRGLTRSLSTANYQGIAIYCEWETDDSEWRWLREHFLSR